MCSLRTSLVFAIVTLSVSLSVNADQSSLLRRVSTSGSVVRSAPNSFPSALVYPLMGPRTSSSYGTRVHPKLKTKRHHHGVDLAAPASAPIRSISSGIVIFADPFGGYGNLIVLKHSDGRTTSHYGHCKTIKVKTGDQVKPGTILGLVGSTGLSTGPHLHFEIRRDGKPLDPETVLPGLSAASDG